MGRVILGVVIGFVAWWVIGGVALFLLRVAWPDYAQVEQAMTFSFPMQIARLAVGVLCSIGGGWLAVTTARGAGTAAWWLGGVLVLCFIPIHYGLWDKFPVWYHLFFLLTLAPLTGFGGRLAPHGSRISTPAA